MIAQCHLPYFAEAFAVPHFFRDPVLVFGHNDASYPGPPGRFEDFKRTAWATFDHLRYRMPPHFRRRPQADIPAPFRHANLHDILPEFGVRSVVTLDLFDPRAQLRQDMNEPVSPEWHERFGTIIDIGNLEHVFDTRQCLSNMFSMLQVGGHFLLHTPCSGYFNHGLHTFSPECLEQSFERNGLEIVYRAFSMPTGQQLEQPSRAVDAICWLVGRKVRPFEKFECPQQGRWERRYRTMT